MGLRARVVGESLHFGFRNHAVAPEGLVRSFQYDGRRHAIKVTSRIIDAVPIEGVEKLGHEIDGLRVIVPKAERKELGLKGEDQQNMRVVLEAMQRSQLEYNSPLDLISQREKIEKKSYNPYRHTFTKVLRGAVGITGLAFAAWTLSDAAFYISNDIYSIGRAAFDLGCLGLGAFLMHGAYQSRKDQKLTENFFNLWQLLNDRSYIDFSKRPGDPGPAIDAEGPI